MLRKDELSCSFFLDKKRSKKSRLYFVSQQFYNLILATQPKLNRQEILRLVPRQDFLSRFQTGLLTLIPRSKIKLKTVRLTKEGRRK